MQIKKIWKDDYIYSLQEIVDLMHQAATFSRDPDTKVGCAIIDDDNHILMLGYNDYPLHLETISPALLERPEKYFWIEHAERNTIYIAGREGIKLKDKTSVQSLFPCTDCARGIIQTGFKKIITYNPFIEKPKYHQEAIARWQNNMKKSLEMLHTASIEINYIDDLLY